MPAKKSSKKKAPAKASSKKSSKKSSTKAKKMHGANVCNGDEDCPFC